MIAWDWGYRKVCLELDSKLVVRWLNTEEVPRSAVANLIIRCKLFMERQWEVQLKHVFRESNRVADCLANEGIKLVRGLLVFNTPPSCVEDFLFSDVAGAVWPMRVVSS